MVHYSDYMQPRHKRELAPTTIYENNYRYAINFYQPMIDYLDAKRKYGKSLYPQLQWSNERALKRYSPHNSVSSYTSAEILQYANELYDNAKSREFNLEDYKVIRRKSPLAVTQSAVGARILKHLNSSSIEEKFVERFKKRDEERKVQDIMEDIKHIKATMNCKRDVEISSGLKNAMRGKTASQISAALLSESRKNIKNSKNEEEVLIRQARSQSRCGSESRIIKRIVRMELVDDKMLDSLDSSMASSMCNVKKQLHGFNQRTEDLYLNSRCCNKYI